MEIYAIWMTYRHWNSIAKRYNKNTENNIWQENYLQLLSKIFVCSGWQIIYPDDWLKRRWQAENKVITVEWQTIRPTSKQVANNKRTAESSNTGHRITECLIYAQWFGCNALKLDFKNIETHRSAKTDPEKHLGEILKIRLLTSDNPIRPNLIERKPRMEIEKAQKWKFIKCVIHIF